MLLVFLMLDARSWMLDVCCLGPILIAVIRHQASSNQHLVSSTQQPASSIQKPASSIELLQPQVSALDGGG
jgi:hypothetical protein